MHEGNMWLFVVTAKLVCGNYNFTPVNLSYRYFSHEKAIY